MKASDFITQFLIEKQTDCVFGYIGGMVTHLVDSIYTTPGIELINTAHEQAAGFAAEGYARTTGKTGVALATSGPGATNLVTPIANCFFDQTPVVFITGQVNSFEYQKFPAIRQYGFQETDIVSIATPITKYAVQVKHAEDLRYELEKAFYEANTGAKGPVLLDLPMDVQRADFDFQTARSFIPPAAKAAPDLSAYAANVADALTHAKRPLLLVGNGVRLSHAVEPLRQFLLRTGLPVVQSLMGIDSVPSDYPYNLGLIGTYGTRYANWAISCADVILVLGSRLDIRQTGADVSPWKNKTVFQVDIDMAQLQAGNFLKTVLCADVATFLEALNKQSISLSKTEWTSRLSALKKQFPVEQSLDGKAHLPNKIMHQLFTEIPDGNAVCVDVGQHQMWAAQSAVIKQKTRVLFSGGLGSMGFAFPAALGVASAGYPATVLCGDGGFQMNLQELVTLARRQFPIKIFIFNNRSLGMVKQFQDMYLDGRNPSTVDDYTAPDFAAISRAYGIPAQTLQAETLTDNDLHACFAQPGPLLICINFNTPTQIHPKCCFGNALDNMSPLLPAAQLQTIKKELQK